MKSWLSALLPTCHTHNTRVKAREAVILICFHTVFHFTRKIPTTPATQENNLILPMYYLKVAVMYHKIIRDGNV